MLSVNKSPFISEENEALCSLHRKPLDHFSRGLFGNGYFTCSECIFDKNSTKIKGEFQGYHKLNVMTMSMDAKTPEEPNLRSSGVQDFKNMRLEHIIMDFQSSGYAPRNLIYLRNEKLLAACSFNGRIVFWSIGDGVKYVSHLHVDKTIRCVKNIVTSEGKSYLLIGAGSEILVYEMIDQKPESVKTIKLENIINDIDYLSDREQIVSVGCEAKIRVWNVKTWEQEKEFDVRHLSGVNDKIATVVYMQEEKKLGLEIEKGFYLIDFQKDEGEKAKLEEEPIRYLSLEKVAFGFAYLPKSKHFLLRTKISTTVLLSYKPEEGFKIVHTYVTPLQFTVVPGLQYVPNQTETQVICNANSRFCLIYSGVDTTKVDIKAPINKVVSVEVIPDDYKLIVADETSGTIAVYRTNTTPMITNSGSSLFGNFYSGSSFNTGSFVRPNNFTSFPKPILNTLPSPQKWIPPPVEAITIRKLPRQTLESSIIQNKRSTRSSLISSRPQTAIQKKPKIIKEKQIKKNVRKTQKKVMPKKAPKPVEKKEKVSKDSKEIRLKGKRIITCTRIRDKSNSIGKGRSKSKPEEKIVYVVLPEKEKKEKKNRKNESKERKSTSKDSNSARKEKEKKPLRGESKPREKKMRNSSERSRSRSKSKSPKRSKTVEETIKKAKSLMKKIRTKIQTKNGEN